MVFEMVDASSIHPGSYISIFKFLPSWKVVQLLGSPERHPSVILGVYEDAERFLRGVLVVFDMVDVSRILQGSCISIFRSLPAWVVLHLLCVSRASSWSLRGRWWLLRGGLVAFNIMDVPNIHKEAVYQFSDLYLPGKCFIS